MISFKPQSIQHLTVAGFLAVSAILVIALILTANKLDGLGRTSQRIVGTATEAMGYSRVLIEQASAMERNVLQFGITGGREILDVYKDRHLRFVHALDLLQAISGSRELDLALETLGRDEALLYEAMSGHGSAQIAPELPAGVLASAYRVAELIGAWNSRRLDELRDDTEQTRKQLTWQAVILVTCAMLMAALFTALITRPLLQLERAIKHIGDGSLRGPIRVSGPRDLVSLGERLEWLRTRFEKLEEQRSLFLRHISHELKTPLASMQESAALLRDGVVGRMTDEQCKLLDIQIKNGKRLLRLIDDLLRHNGERFSLLNVPPEAVPLERVLDQVLGDNDPLIRSRNLRISCEGTAITVKGHFEQLRVVFDNLLGNAIRFSPAGGEIRIVFSSSDGASQVDILDEGPGIPVDEMEDIFIPFFQGKNAGFDRQPSTGLGLAIAMEYSLANAGSIEVVESSAGAHFRLTFPESDRGSSLNESR